MRYTQRFVLVSALAIAAAGGSVAYAQDPAAPADTFVSTQSREQVLADYFAFVKSGVNPWSGSYNPLSHIKHTLTREQVEGEFIAARRQVAAFAGEDSGSAYLSVHWPNQPAASDAQLAVKP